MLGAGLLVPSVFHTARAKLVKMLAAYGASFHVGCFCPLCRTDIGITHGQSEGLRWLVLYYCVEEFAHVHVCLSLPGHSAYF